MLTSFLVLEITALISLIWALKFKITKLTWVTMLIVTILNAGYVYWLMPVPTLSQLVMPVAVESAIVVVWALITGASAQVVQRVTKRGTHISLEGLTIWPFIIRIMNGQIVNPSRLMCVPRFVTRCTTCADAPVINAHTTTIADSTATGITNCDNVGTGINQYT